MNHPQRPLRTVTYQGTLLAQTSIAHGGKESGTIHNFRRETCILPSGQLLAGVPVISGSVVRGSLRRLAAEMAHRFIRNGDRLPLPVVHALRTGGALRETRSTKEVLTGEKQARLRDLIPMLGVFGFSAGGRIASGRLLVDKPIPLAKETLFLLDHYDLDLGAYQPPSIWQMIQQETYTRYADVTDAATQPLIEDTDAEDRELPKGAGTMMWSQETLAPGTRLFHSLVLEGGTPVEVSFFDDLVTTWSKKARIGGQIGRGLGRVAPNYTRTSQVVLGDGGEADDSPTPLNSSLWQQWMSEHANEIEEVIGWL